MNKFCKRCNSLKEVSEFFKNKRRKEGYADWCKNCCKIWHNENKKKIKDWYLKNKEELKIKRKQYIEKNRGKINKTIQNLRTRCRWYQSYNNVYSRCNNPKNITYKNYGGKGIKCLMKPNDFKLLWFRDKAYLMKQPSIHRKNNRKNYIISNCRFIEMKKHRTFKRGKYNKGGK